MPTNLNDTTPVAPAGSRNGKWQVTDWYVDSQGRTVRDASVYLPDVIRSVTAVAFDSTAIATGIIGTAIQVSFAGTIIGWSIELDASDSISVAVSKKASSVPPAAPSVPNTTTDKISASAPIATSSAASASSGASGVSTWTTSVAQWDTLLFNIATVGGVAKRATIVLLIQQS